MIDKTTLPDKLTDLLELALSDLKKVADSPKYYIHMERYYNGSRTGPCMVCFAGAVMAKSLNAKWKPNIDAPGSALCGTRSR